MNHAVCPIYKHNAVQHSTHIYLLHHDLLLLNCNNNYYKLLSPFIDFHFENILSSVMLQDFLGEIEFVPTTLKKIAFIS